MGLINLWFRGAKVKKTASLEPHGIKGLHLEPLRAISGSFFGVSVGLVSCDW